MTELSQRIRAYGYTEEVEMIQKRADREGLSMSNYVRKALGLPPLERGRPKKATKKTTRKSNAVE
jgi:hypothetical protein